MNEATLLGTEEQQRLARWIFNLMMIQGTAYGTGQPIEVTLDDLVDYFRRQPDVDGGPDELAQKIEEAVGENPHIFRRFKERDKVVYAVTKGVQLVEAEPVEPAPKAKPARAPEPKPKPAEKPPAPGKVSWPAEKQKVIAKLESLRLEVRRSGGDYVVNDRVALTMLSSGLKGHWYWFGLPTRFHDLMKEYDAYFLLLLCDSADTVLVLPDELVQEWVRHVTVRGDRYHVHVTFEEGRYELPELDNRDVTDMLNNFEAIARAAQ